jgi:iron-sulfur cluster repair protein YtfE (RIC family)
MRDGRQPVAPDIAYDGRADERLVGAQTEGDSMNSPRTETPTQAWSRRATHSGEVDFTMMYVAHDAFNRDLIRLLAAARAGDGFSPAALATWELFHRQLHTHHTAEDTALWPRLRAATHAEEERSLLDEMEAEHGELDPRLQRIEAALADRHTEDLVTELEGLADGLAEHMRHEEDAALPLVERRIGAAGWKAFGDEIRAQNGGIRGGALYLPWVLDGATPDVRSKVLRILPPPARLLYRGWERKYRSAGRLLG